MSGKQSAKPRFGGVFFGLKKSCLRFSPLYVEHARVRQAPVRAMHHLFQQIA